MISLNASPEDIYSISWKWKIINNESQLAPSILKDMQSLQIAYFDALNEIW